MQRDRHDYVEYELGAWDQTDGTPARVENEKIKSKQAVRKLQLMKPELIDLMIPHNEVLHPHLIRMKDQPLLQDQRVDVRRSSSAPHHKASNTDLHLIR